MPIRGNPRSYYKKFSFVVEIDQVAFAGFQSCSELSEEVAVVEQWEGGVLVPNSSPGRVTITEITLERGATNDLDLWNWFKEVVNVAANSGLVDDEYKRDIEVVQLDRDGTVLRRWAINGAWPRKFKAGEWDNTVDENVMESVTLKYNYFEPIASAGDAG